MVGKILQQIFPIGKLILLTGH